MKHASTRIAGENAGKKSGLNIKDTNDIQLHSGGGRRFVRFFVVAVGVLFVGLLVGLIGIFLMFQGGAIENDTLNRRIENSITAFLGPQYDVILGATSFEINGVGLVSITSSDVELKKVGETEPVAIISKVLVGVEPWSLLNGTPKVNSVTLKGPQIDLKQLTSGERVAIPVELNEAFNLFGANLAKMNTRVTSAKLKKISIVDGELLGLKLGPRSTGKLIINELDLTIPRQNEIAIAMKADSGVSTFAATANYSHTPNGPAKLNVNIEGISLLEWVQDPAILKNLKGFIASNSKVNGEIKLAFTKDNKVQQPTVNIVVGNGDLRLGRKGRTKIRQIALNFRLFPKHNRIIMERSQLSVGDFLAQIVGGITPVDPSKGFAGDIDYTLVVERGQGKPAQQGEKTYPVSMIVDGGYNRVAKLLNIDQMNMNLDGGNLVGSASFGFGGETPSLVFNGVSQGMPMAALKQIWPISIATGARKWVREHVHGGKITSATITASIPAGILGRLHKGRRFEDNQLEIDLNVENTRFDTFGQLPPVRSVIGKVRVRGMKTEVNLDSGVAYVAKGEPVKITRGNFLLPDIALRPLPAEVSFIAKGSIAGLAQITDAKPLAVMSKLKMTPKQWSGRGEVDLVAKFPLKKKLQYQEVDWQALVHLAKAKSSKLITGRRISNADVVIDISPDKAVITGDSTIDGIRGNVLMIEPVGKNSRVKRKRVLKARMGPKDRKKLGVTVEPVISGIIDVVMEQYEGRKAAQISVDLKDAKIELPWIGWQKGKGIPAKANFQMVNNKNNTKIKGLELRGDGFSLDGNFVFDKNGINSVDISKVALNQNDDIAVRIRRDKGDFIITANGKNFDGRGLVNKLFHQEGVADEQGKATFRLSANIEKVKGFGNRFANNLVLHYSVKQGWLDGLSLNTGFGRASRTTIEAGTKGENTKFQIRSENAGSALSFLNLYTHMRNGVMVSNLKRRRGKPFFGNVFVEKFTIVNEPKLKKLVSNRQINDDRVVSSSQQRKLKKIETHTANFISAQADIEKGQGYLKMDGSLTGVQIGLTYDGTLFDNKNRMNLQGTFMPAFGLSRIVSAIPFVGQILSNGKDSGLIGINYHLSGPTASPNLTLNPLSVVAPGIFKKVFQPQRQ